MKRHHRETANLFQELIVDNFAGGGGQARVSRKPWVAMLTLRSIMTKPQSRYTRRITRELRNAGYEVEWKAAQATANELKAVFDTNVSTLRKMIVEESDPGIFRGVEGDAE